MAFYLSKKDIPQYHNNYLYLAYVLAQAWSVKLVAQNRFHRPKVIEASGYRTISAAIAGILYRYGSKVFKNV